MATPGSISEILVGAASAGDYTISRSLRFNSADSAYLSRTPASAGNRKTWTWAGWVKRSALGAAYKMIFSAGTVSTECSLRFTDTPSDALQFYQYSGGGFNWQLATTQVFRDPSAWYHIVAAVDSTQATASSRAKLYVNGVQVTAFGTASYPSLNYDSLVNSTTEHGIGRVSASQYFDGYLADVHFIDGQALDPTSFGELSATTGVWMPKAYTGTYGTNGFKLNFSDNSAATATTLGKDSSGNGNNFTPNNLSVTAGAGNDSLVDVPTNGSETDTGVGGEVRGNYCTLNPLIKAAATTLTNGNLDVAYGGWNSSFGTVAIPTSGKWFFEVTTTTTEPLIGIALASANLSSASTTYFSNPVVSYSYYATGAKALGPGNTQTSYGASIPSGTVVGVAYDADAGSITFYNNGVSQGVAFTGITGQYVPAMGSSASSLVANFGQRPFAYTAPSGFKALCTANLPAPTIVKPSTVMDVVTYTGTGSTLTPTSSLGFNPDLIWIKSRSAATDHALYDSVRGAQARLESNNTDAEVTSDSGVTAFNTAGFTLGTLAQVNTNAATYAAWTWDAGSSTVTNTAGTISSQVRANASAGFSIVTYTGNGVTGATVGHGLGVTPSLVILKRRDVGSTNWYTYHSSIGNTGALALNVTSGTITSGNFWNNTSPTSTVITISATGGGEVNGNGGTFVLYCFAPVAGYSAFGSYTGNGSTDGPFVYTGFRPRWVMVKASSSTGSWYIYDSKRDTYNVATSALFPNSNSNELSIPAMDLLSNGLKLKYEATYGANYNGSGVTYVYAAFAESPFSLARAR